MRYDLKDTTIIIPVKYDSEDRIHNTKAVIIHLFNSLETNLIIIETGKEQKIYKSLVDDIAAMNIKYIYFEADEKLFCGRLKLTNEALKEVTTPYFGMCDSDVIVPAKSCLGAITQFREKKASAVLPYNSLTYDVSRDLRNRIIEEKTIEWLTPEMCKAINPVTVAQGGIAFFTKDAYEDVGKGNENFKAYAPEDQELMYRTQKLGHKLVRIVGPIFHLTHERLYNSSHTHSHYRLNYEEFEKVKKMTEKELRDYMKAQPWNK
jgi:predicted glycosyltransferase involved in capsule biosynthesis